MTTPGAPGPVRALVVDDEEALRRLVSSYLQQEGFEVTTAADGEQAITLAHSTRPAVVVLDLMLPGVDGVETCRRIRTFSDAYIVMLTARAEEVDKLVGLSVGADDYLTKPFSPRELVARVRAMLRRPRTTGTDLPSQRTFGELSVDPAARTAHVAGRPVTLTRTEFDLLDTLTRQPRVVLTRQQLIEHVWGPGWHGDEHLVDVHVANLRRKLGGQRYIHTVRGVGYRMEGPP